MGGNPISIISSVLGVAGSLTKKPDGSRDNSADLAAERAAREEEQRQREAEERRRDRDKVTEARELEKRRKTKKSETSATLPSGAAGLINDPAIAAAGLKKKLGE